MSDMRLVTQTTYNGADNAQQLDLWAYDLETGNGGLWYDQPMAFANGMALSPDGRSFIMLGYPHYGRCAALIEGRSEVSWDHRASIRSCNFSQDGRLMASGDHNGKLFLQRTMKSSLS